MASKVWLAVVFLLLAATPASAAEAPPAGRDVIVKGHRPETPKQRQRELQAFVRRVPAANNGEALARWVQPICPVVAGMTEEQAKFVLVRLFQVAREAGAPAVEDGHCGVNAVIVATAAPEALVKAWERRIPVIFLKARPDQLRRLEAPGRTVRTWYTARLDALLSTREGVPGLSELPVSVPVITFAMNSRLQTSSSYAMSGVIIVVDSARAAGTNMGALADYLAFASLVQLKPEADSTDASSILGLFSPSRSSDPPDGLTSWDKAFLHALYHTKLEDMHQGQSIVFHMNQELSRPAPAQ